MSKEPADKRRARYVTSKTKNDAQIAARADVPTVGGVFAPLFDRPYPIPEKAPNMRTYKGA